MTAVGEGRRACTAHMKQQSAVVHDFVFGLLLEVDNQVRRRFVGVSSPFPSESTSSTAFIPDPPAAALGALGPGVKGEWRELTVLCSDRRVHPHRHFNSSSFDEPKPRFVELYSSPDPPAKKIINEPPTFSTLSGISSAAISQNNLRKIGKPDARFVPPEDNLSSFADSELCRYTRLNPQNHTPPVTTHSSCLQLLSRVTWSGARLMTTSTWIPE
nr:hypothetical protein CFP56_31682 [Quercus suber]